MKKLSEYHFSAGNSSKGPIGFCAVVRAHSKAEAVEILQSALPEEEYNTGIEANDGRIEYVNVYFNSQAVKASQIDAVTPCDKCEDCGAYVSEIVGCPDGAEVCRDCFDAGAH